MRKRLTKRPNLDKFGLWSYTKLNWLWIAFFANFLSICSSTADLPLNTIFTWNRDYSTWIIVANLSLLNSSRIYFYELRFFFFCFLRASRSRTSRACVLIKFVLKRVLRDRGLSQAAPLLFESRQRAADNIWLPSKNKRCETLLFIFLLSLSALSQSDRDFLEVESTLLCILLSFFVQFWVFSCHPEFLSIRFKFLSIFENCKSFNLFILA